MHNKIIKTILLICFSIHLLGCSSGLVKTSTINFIDGSEIAYKEETFQQQVLREEKESKLPPSQRTKESDQDAEQKFGLLFGLLNMIFQPLFN